MDQLSAQTPPMKDNVPVIGQVSINNFPNLIFILKFFVGLLITLLGILLNFVDLSN